MEKHWKNLRKPAAFSSAANVARAVGRQEGAVKRELEKSVLYQAHRDLRENFEKRANFATRPLQRWEMDLGDLGSRIPPERTGLPIIPGRRRQIQFLLCVDVFSRQSYARALMGKKGAYVAEALKSIFKEAKGHPEVLASDAGERSRCLNESGAQQQCLGPAVTAADCKLATLRREPGCCSMPNCCNRERRKYAVERCFVQLSLLARTVVTRRDPNAPVMPRPYIWVLFIAGLEFKNKAVKELLDSLGIRHKIETGAGKARTCERYMRSIKRIIMAAEQSKSYPKNTTWNDVPILAARDMNSRYNRMIGAAPDDAAADADVRAQIRRREWRDASFVPVAKYLADEAALREGGEVGGLAVGDAVLPPIPKKRRGEVYDKEFMMHYSLLPMEVAEVFHGRQPYLYALKNPRTGRRARRLYYGVELKKMSFPFPIRKILGVKVEGGRAVYKLDGQADASVA